MQLSEKTQYSSLEPEIDYEDLRRKIALRMTEIYEGWKERQLTNNAIKLIEIDPELKLSLNGYIDA